MLANIVAVIALALSVVTFAFSQRSARATDRRSRIPVLVFVYDPNGNWFLRNVGNGPALNIVLAVKARHEDERWQDLTRIPPISRDGDFRLDWLGDADVAVIAAAYEDFLAADNPGKSRTYTVTMSNDVNRIVPRRELPQWGVHESLAYWQRENKGLRRWPGHLRDSFRRGSS